MNFFILLGIISNNLIYFIKKSRMSTQIFLFKYNFHITFQNHTFSIFIFFAHSFFSFSLYYFNFHSRLEEEVYIYVRTKFAQRHLRQVVLTQHFPNNSSYHLKIIYFHTFFPIFLKVILLFYIFQVF